MTVNLIPGMQISASGLHAERQRMEVASHNLANTHSTRDASGNVYRRQQVVFSTTLLDKVRDGGPTSRLGGVTVTDIIEDSRPPISVYAPHHPHADADGMVLRPNVSPIEEMLDMITATRAYEANLAALKEGRAMADKTIGMLQHG